MTTKQAVITATIVGSILTIVFGWGIGLTAGFVTSFVLTPKEEKK